MEGGVLLTIGKGVEEGGNASCKIKGERKDETSRKLREGGRDAGQSKTDEEWLAACGFENYGARRILKKGKREEKRLRNRLPTKRRRAAFAGRRGKRRLEGRKGGRLRIKEPWGIARVTALQQSHPLKGRWPEKKRCSSL